MDASDLERSISDFSNSLSNLNGWLVGMTAVVVLGLLLEYVPELKDEWKRFLEAGAWKSLISRQSQAWKPLAILLGAVMVTGGVAGEMVFEALSFHKEGQLEKAHFDLDEYLRNKSESAETSAKGAVDDFKTAQGQLKGLTLKAGELDRQLDATKNSLNTAKSQLDAVDAKRAELEKSLINMAVCTAPRVIKTWMILGGGKGQTYADPLRPMVGQKVFIEFVPDPEARRAAINLASTLSDAKWDVQLPLRVVDGLEDGVSVQPSQAGIGPSQNKPPEKPLEGIEARAKATDVADKLVDFLHSYNWQANRGWPLDAQHKMIRDPGILPAGTIRVQIGLYPAVEYVSPPGEKDYVDADSRSKHDWQERTKKMEEERRKKEEEIIKNLTPQEALKFRADSERRKEEQKQWDERYFGPCHPINWFIPGLNP